MSPRLPIRYSRRFVIFFFCSAYTGMILNYIGGYIFGEIDIGVLIISILFFLDGCSLLLGDGLFTVEPRLSRRASIALVTIGLCLYAPVPYFVLQGYLRPIYQYPLVDPVIDLAIVVILALGLFFVPLIYRLIPYKEIPVTETQRT